MYVAVIRPERPRRPVHPTRRQRRAPQDPPGAQHTPAKCTDGTDGLLRVLRATRVEAALSAEHPAERRAIDPYGCDQQDARGSSGPPQRVADPAHAITPARCRERSTSARTSSRPAPTISGRATNMIQWPVSTRGRTPRQASRMSRRARFRTTAPPTLREHANAARLSPSTPSTYTVTRFPESRRPWDMTRRTSTVRLMLGAARTVMTGLSPTICASGSRRSSGRQLGPALAATTGQDPPAGPRPHPDTEAVGLLPLAVVGLERALHVTSALQMRPGNGGTGRDVVPPSIAARSPQKGRQDTPVALAAWNS
jgi:hypothetical protein